MIIGENSTYLRHRLVQEQELAKAAVCDVSRRAHAKLAEMYQAKLAVEKATEANSTPVR